MPRAKGDKPINDPAQSQHRLFDRRPPATRYDTQTPEGALASVDAFRQLAVPDPMDFPTRIDSMIDLVRAVLTDEGVPLSAEKPPIASLKEPGARLKVVPGIGFVVGDQVISERAQLALSLAVRLQAAKSRLPECGANELLFAIEWGEALRLTEQIAVLPREPDAITGAKVRESNQRAGRAKTNPERDRLIAEQVQELREEHGFKASAAWTKVGQQFKIGSEAVKLAVSRHAKRCQ